jgi:hypothetical protein
MCCDSLQDQRGSQAKTARSKTEAVHSSKMSVDFTGVHGFTSQMYHNGTNFVIAECVIPEWASLFSMLPDKYHTKFRLFTNDYYLFNVYST